MVFFGDPIPQHDHAERAVRMAFEMRERMTNLQDRWQRHYHEAFKIGIGIATGWVTHMVHATPVDQVRLKGVSRETKVYEIHPLTPWVRATG